MGMSGGVERESECEATGRAELELGLVGITHDFTGTIGTDY